MADCELLESCSFFNDKMANKSAAAEIYRNNFCRGHSEDCARYMVAKAFGSENVPADLFPNQMEKALLLMSRK